MAWRRLDRHPTQLCCLFDTTGWIAMLQKILLLYRRLAFSSACQRARRMRRCRTVPEKDTVQNACSACHALSMVTNAGHSKAEWDTVVHMMVNVGRPGAGRPVRDGGGLPRQEFSGQGRARGAGRSGNTSKSPSRNGTCPRRARVRTIRWSRRTDRSGTRGQMANVLGRFDPKTQQFKEYHLPEGSGPHGLIADHDGNVWFTANFKRLYRQARSQDRRGQAISHARSEGARSAYAAACAQWQYLFHGAGRQHGGAAQSQDGRDQAGAHRPRRARIPMAW